MNLFIIFIFIISILLTFIVLNYISPIIKKNNFRVKNRDLGTENFKQGTPSMGGLSFVVTGFLIFISLLFIPHSISKLDLTTVFIPFFIFSFIGFIDDFLKMKYGGTEGFKFLPKLFSQIGGAILSAFVLLFNKNLFDFFKNLSINEMIIFLIIVVIWFVGWSNATNLTDGIDGLLSGLAIISYLGYLIYSISLNNASLIIFDVFMIGSLVGFLLKNKPVAKIFMGDIGSLSIGAGLVVNSILLGNPFTLIWFGLIYELEALAVIIQVVSFRFFKKRVFPITPIHHSFERLGLSEWEIDFYFSIVQFILTFIGVAFLF